MAIEAAAGSCLLLLLGHCSGMGLLLRGLVGGFAVAGAAVAGFATPAVAADAAGFFFFCCNCCSVVTVAVTVDVLSAPVFVILATL